MENLFLGAFLSFRPPFSSLCVSCLDFLIDSTSSFRICGWSDTQVGVGREDMWEMWGGRGEKLNNISSDFLLHSQFFEESWRLYICILCSQIHSSYFVCHRDFMVERESLSENGEKRKFMWEDNLYVFVGYSRSIWLGFETYCTISNRYFQITVKYNSSSSSL